MVDLQSRTLAVLPLSTAGGAVRKATEGALDMRSILVEGDIIAVSCLCLRIFMLSLCCVLGLKSDLHMCTFLACLLTTILLLFMIGCLYKSDNILTLVGCI